LTTPGCDEKVEWFVVDRPILTISEDQLLSFQDLEDNHGFPVSFISFNFIF
jgi:carbonic anhydrase